MNELWIPEELLSLARVAQEHAAGGLFRIADARSALADNVARLCQLGGAELVGRGGWSRTVFGAIDEQISSAASDTERLAETDFLRSHLDGLIILVLGRVNAGKSSLGNLMSEHLARAIPVSHGDKQAPCKRYFAVESAPSGELIVEESDQPFEVDATECTSRIQGARLGRGLCWVDSPGLASMTEENGALARRYVDAADLILFVTNSDSPMERSDMEVLEQLGVQEQRLVAVVLTRSDQRVHEYDEAAGALRACLRPLAPEDRAAQEKYVRAEIDKLGASAALGKREILSLSAHLATEALTTGAEHAWVDSGLARFCDLIREALISDAAVLKAQAPVRSFNAQLERITGRPADSSGLSGILEGLRATETAFRLANDRWTRSAETIQAEVWSEVREAADLFLRNWHGAGSDVSTSSELGPQQSRKMNLDSTVEAAVKGRILTHGQEMLEGLLGELPDIEVRASNVELASRGVSQLFEEKDVPDDAGHRTMGSAVGAGLGVLVGTLGGPVGMLLGSLAGGWAGDRLASGRTTRVRLPKGTDEHEVRAEALAKLKPLVIKASVQSCERFRRVAITRELERVVQLSTDLQRIRETMLELRVST